MTDIYAYTDGAFSSAREQGGVGIVFVKDNEIIYKYSKCIQKTTNNRCELIAVIKTLQALAKPIDKLVIYSDSQYVICSINKGWQRKKNKDLWALFDYFYDQAQKYCSDIQFEWVKGHENNDTNKSKWNNLADSLAVEASHEFCGYEG